MYIICGEVATFSYLKPLLCFCWGQDVDNTYSDSDVIVNSDEEDLEFNIWLLLSYCFKLMY